SLISTAADRHDTPPPIYALDGMPGIGKTALAVHLAHKIADKFPDGVHFLDLHGHTATRKPVDPTEALQSLLIIFGVAADQVPPGLDERVGMWRRRMAGQRVLLVADNAADEEQLRPLIPNSPGMVVLVTSRRSLGNLPDVTSTTLEEMSPDHAVDMFLRLSRTTADQAGRRKTGELVKLCGYLPLAIALTAGRLRSHPTWTLDDLAHQLTETQRVVGGLYSGDSSVEAAFDLSYRDLPSEEKQLFRRLTLHPGAEIGIHAAAALDDAEVPATRRRLESLFLNHLVAEPAAGRYRLHDLIREYAGGLSDRDPAEDRQNATVRMLYHYLRIAGDACQQVYARHPGGEHVVWSSFRTSREAEEWMSLEHANLDACIDYSATQGLPHTTRLAIAVHPFLVQTGQW
ncbi:MAG: ATP-binding protein, partial [Acidimicrobiales bacterium]